MNRKSLFLFSLFMGMGLLLGPEIGLASVESTLTAVQAKLINVSLPLVAILGMVFAAFSFFIGNPGAKNHFILAIMGAVIGFGAPSIISFIRGLIH